MNVTDSPYEKYLFPTQLLMYASLVLLASGVLMPYDFLIHSVFAMLHFLVMLSMANYMKSTVDRWALRIVVSLCIVGIIAANVFLFPPI